MKVWLDDKVLFNEARDLDLSSKYPVKIHCNSAPVELKSVLVKPGTNK